MLISEARQGVDWQISLIVTEDSAPVNITGYVVKLGIRASEGNDLLLLEVGTGATITNGPAGAVSFRVTAAQTLVLPVGIHEFNVIAAPAGSGQIVTEWLVGRLTVDRRLA
tara:strand:+ start:61 stop:393 length:333 start_codon:yes stop_codon:yes gene_type:complete